MASKNIDPWITEEYAKQLKEERKKLRETWTEEMAAEMVARAAEAGAMDGAEIKRKREERIKEVGIEGYVAELVQHSNELIEQFKNPTPEERFKYTEAFFKEMIEVQKDFLENAPNFLKEMKKLINQSKNKYRKKEHLKNQDIITLKSIVPNNYTIPNNKLSNEIPKDLLGIGEVALTVCKGKKEVLTTVSVDYDSEGIQIYNKSERFTPYDRVVHNAVCSLYEAGNTEFTALMVYRCMNGLVNNEKVSPQAVGAVTKSLDKVSRIRCKIDWTAEAQARGVNIDNGLLEGNILATKKITVTTSGKTIEAYQLLDKPILYTYAQTTKQVITIPIKLLQTKEKLRSTDEVIVIREYLIRRIEVIKNSNKHSNKILYDSIFKEMGLINPTKQKKEKVRKAVKEILNYWINENYITKFEEYKEGRTFKGLNLFY
ncbi:hypothetical protein DP144_13865 [Clostridium tetani]|uniref:hypothetical protein n=1 Tax=Clostridium tetani TaxID=1513 RepID=UPI00100A6857|nr:hypothetical protein [Clostridium tetani]RXM73650.1 hypothetical protein DP154_13955 [Clostridium tetani]RYU97815.1 hypothetical protein DP144_13865 [Clostridium tetani]